MNDLIERKKRHDILWKNFSDRAKYSMSTIAEHLAELEFHAANGYGQAFASSAFMFTQVHWQELLRMIPDDEIEAARAQTKQRIIDQHGDASADSIKKWEKFIDR